jgi:hypothetical protein
MIRTWTYYLSEVQSTLPVMVETLERIEWFKEVLDWQRGSGIQTTLPGKALGWEWSEKILGESYRGSSPTVSVRLAETLAAR